MPDAAWKAWERTVAKWFGGYRRGPDTAEGKTDVVADGWAIECKLLGRPAFSDLLAAARQAESNGSPDEIPVAVVRKKGRPITEALVVMRLETFAPWFLPESQHPPEPEISVPYQRPLLR